MRLDESLFQLARVISIFNTWSKLMANIFLDHRTVQSSISVYPLTDDGPQFVNKFIMLVCGYLRVERQRTTAYYPQASGQAEHLNCTTCTRLWHCVAKYQQVWYLCVKPLTYRYSTQTCRSENVLPHRLVLSLNIPGQPSIQATPSLVSNPIRLSPQQMRRRVEAHPATLQTNADTRMQKIRTQ